MSRLSRERLIRSGLVLALLAGVLAVTIGTGYRSSEALLDSASAWLPRDGELVRVNAVTGDVDAQAAAAVELATGTQPFEAVQVSPGVVYVVNNETGEAWRMPTDTLQPQPVLPDQDAAAAGDRQLAGDAGQAYLLDEQGNLSVLEAPDQGPIGPVPLPPDVQLDQLHVDSTGTAWALSGQRGELYEVQGVTVRAAHPIPQPGQPALLTLAGDRPVVYQPTAGVAAMFGPDGVRRVDGLVPANERDVHLSSADEPVLVVAVQSSGELFKVDFEEAQGSPRVQLRGRAGARFGPLVVASGFVYLPDHRNRHVVVVELGSLREVRDVAVPGTADIELVARDGWVWANDPYGALFSFDRDGQPRELDDGGDEPAEPEPDQEQPEQPQPSPEQPLPEQPAPPPAQEEEEEPEPVQVPDVAGQDRIAACEQIEDAGLECEPVAEVRAGCPSGQVISTDPAAGSPVPPESTVTVTFCTPPRTVVPASGATVDETCVAVQAAALTCQPVVAGYAANTGEFHRVVSYEPAAGTEVDAGTAVTVGYLEQPASVAVPSVVGMDPTAACQTLQTVFLQCSPVADFQTPTVGIVQQQNAPAGTAVPPGTAVQYFYEDIGPLPLNRFKLTGVEARFLGLGGPPAGAWDPQAVIGSVYAPGEAGVPGLTVVNQFHCQPNCLENRPQGYYYQATAQPPTERWQMSGPAFSCFANPVPGTVPLQAMFSDTRRAWGFAPLPSGEHDFHADPAHGAYTDRFTVCYIWPR
jgi:PASTA domain